MEPRLLSYKRSEINYYRFGTGARPAFCFHGYGEEASTFRFLEKKAGSQYTFFAMDLPYHGKTRWNEGLNFSMSDLLSIVWGILEAENQQQNLAFRQGPASEQKLTLLGFSLGGRMALAIYQSIPRQIEKIVLMAPDGLKMNFWYWLSTQTWMGNRFFAITMKHPGWFFGLLKALNKLGFVNASIFKFVRYYIGDPEARTLLYDRWTSLRKIKPDIARIRHLISKCQTPVRLIYGRHDRIILPVRGEKFKKGIEEHCKISIIESGHQVLHEKHAGPIVEQLLSV